MTEVRACAVVPLVSPEMECSQTSSSLGSHLGHVAQCRRVRLLRTREAELVSAKAVDICHATRPEWCASREGEDTTALVEEMSR